MIASLFPTTQNWVTWSKPIHVGSWGKMVFLCVQEETQNITGFGGGITISAIPAFSCIIQQLINNEFLPCLYHLSDVDILWILFYRWGNWRSDLLRGFYFSESLILSSYWSEMIYLSYIIKFGLWLVNISKYHNSAFQIVCF